MWVVTNCQAPFRHDFVAIRISKLTLRHNFIQNKKAGKEGEREWIMETGRKLKHKSINAIAQRDFTIATVSSNAICINLNLLTPNRFEHNVDIKSQFPKDLFAPPRLAFHISSLSHWFYCTIALIAVALMNYALKLLFVVRWETTALHLFFYSLHKASSCSLFLRLSFLLSTRIGAINMLFLLSFISSRGLMGWVMWHFHKKLL